MTQGVGSYPLEWPDGWPRTPENERRSSYVFRTTFERARDDLMVELERLDAGNVVISSWLAIRRDGQMYQDSARRRIPDPGCALYFSRRGSPIVIAQDRYDTVHGNLRSIGLAIEHLRGLERHGGGHMMERAFEGFLALPPPASAGRPWRTVLEMPPLDLARDDALMLAEAKFKSLAKKHHTDTGGGSTDAMAEINVAIEQARKELAPP